MTRKITSGPIRDKERTKTILMNAVGSILKKKGFSALNVSQVATKAKVDRKLIYEYFGGFEGLVKEYLNSKDYWRASQERVSKVIELGKADYGKQIAYHLLEEQFDSLMADEEKRKIVTWGLLDNSEPLMELAREREIVGEELFSTMTDDFFRDKDKDLRAVTSILVSGIYYLTLHAKMNGTPICGVDINQEAGRLKIKKTLKQIIDWTYT